MINMSFIIEQHKSLEKCHLINCTKKKEDGNMQHTIYFLVYITIKIYNSNFENRMQLKKMAKNGKTFAIITKSCHIQMLSIVLLPFPCP